MFSFCVQCSGGVGGAEGRAGRLGERPGKPFLAQGVRGAREVWHTPGVGAGPAHQQKHRTPASPQPAHLKLLTKRACRLVLRRQAAMSRTCGPEAGKGCISCGRFQSLAAGQAGAAQAGGHVRDLRAEGQAKGVRKGAAGSGTNLLRTPAHRMAGMQGVSSPALKQPGCGQQLGSS